MLKPEEMSLVGSVCRKRAGLRIEPSKSYQVESRLGPVARREGFASASDLIAKVQAGDERLAWLMVEAMAQAETSFFRDMLPFEQFEGDLLPALAQARAGAPVKVWSAACASGQEVYSLAMAAGRKPELAVEFLATDLSESALRKAHSGLYTQFEIQRGLPARLLVEHFTKSGEAWQISSRLRSAIRWRQLNLVGDLSALPVFDIIFCRNVLCLLDEPFQKSVLEALSARLAPDGVLVLGLRESAQAAGGLLFQIEGRPGLYRRTPERKAA